MDSTVEFRNVTFAYPTDPTLQVYCVSCVFALVKLNTVCVLLSQNIFCHILENVVTLLPYCHKAYISYSMATYERHAYLLSWRFLLPW